MLHQVLWYSWYSLVQKIMSTLSMISENQLLSPCHIKVMHTWNKHWPVVVLPDESNLNDSYLLQLNKGLINRAPAVQDNTAQEIGFINPCFRTIASKSGFLSSEEWSFLVILASTENMMQENPQHVVRYSFPNGWALNELTSPSVCLNQISILLSKQTIQEGKNLHIFIPHCYHRA